jgi:hypothetical protein
VDDDASPKKGDQITLLRCSLSTGLLGLFFFDPVPLVLGLPLPPCAAR